jgi:hypothetical protein
MKKRWLLSSCLIVSLFPISAQERLAVFSVEKDTAKQLPCISIDFFRSIPNGELYGSIGPYFNLKYKAIGHTLFDGKAKEELSPETGIGYFGEGNAVVLPHYRKFLNAVIGACKGQWQNADTLFALQEKVWCFNVLDELGFISRAATDQQVAYKKAKEQFTFRYCLTNVPSDTARTVQNLQAILSKASQVYFNRKYTIKATEKPDSIRLTDSTIVYRQSIKSHTIISHYNNIPIWELKKFSAALKDAIYLYIQDYRILPGQVTFHPLPRAPAGYLVTFSAGEGGAGYTMNYCLTGNEAAGLR